MKVRYTRPDEKPLQRHRVGLHLLEQKANEGPGVTLGLPGPSLEAGALGTPESVPYRETEKPRLMTNPAGWPQKVRTAGLADNVLFLVLAPAGTTGTALLHHSLAALMEDSSAFLTPEKRASGPSSDSHLDMPGPGWPGPGRTPERLCSVCSPHSQVLPSNSLREHFRHWTHK